MKLVFVFLSLLVSIPVSAQVVPEWRGAGRTGVYPDTGLLNTWPEGGPAKLWTAGELGTGYSSPAIGTDYIYVTGRIDSLEMITALDFNGNPVWQVSFGKAWNRSYEDSRTTPTLFDGKIYVVSGMGEVACHDQKSGQKIWYRDAFREFSGQCNEFGISDAPLVVGDKVFFTHTST